MGYRLVGAIAAIAGLLAAQHGEAEPATESPPARAHQRAPAAPNGTARRATHAPQPTLPPLVAWLHVKLANEAFALAGKRKLPPPEQPQRPAGAGRYVCAVIVCADADIEVARPLGLARKDVLVLRVPGPFVSPECVALLDRVVQQERLSLVLLLGHDDCRTLLPTPTGQPDQLSRRTRELDRIWRRPDQTLNDALLFRQRELLLASSQLLRDKLMRDELRVVPGQIDVDTGRISWRHRRIDVLPLAPVK